jgi:hypothetical protein
MHLMNRRGWTLATLALLTGVFASGCSGTGGGQKSKPKLLASIPGWQVAMENYFVMELPGNMRRRKVEGFDSTVGIYRSGTMELHFDVKDALVYDSRRARARLAELQSQFKPNVEIQPGGKGVIEVNGRLAYLQHEPSAKWKALGYPYENALQIFFPDPSGGSLAVLLVYKSDEQLEDAVKILRSIRFRR